MRQHCKAKPLPAQRPTGLPLQPLYTSASPGPPMPADSFSSQTSRTALPEWDAALDPFASPQGPAVPGSCPDHSLLALAQELRIPSQTFALLRGVPGIAATRKHPPQDVLGKQEPRQELVVSFWKA